jgi:hypothetical protein
MSIYLFDYALLFLVFTSTLCFITVIYSTLNVYYLYWHNTLRLFFIFDFYCINFLIFSPINSSIFALIIYTILYQLHSLTFLIYYCNLFLISHLPSLYYQQIVYYCFTHFFHAYYSYSLILIFIIFLHFFYN